MGDWSIANLVDLHLHRGTFLEAKTRPLVALHKIWTLPAFPEAWKTAQCTVSVQL